MMTVSRYECMADTLHNINKCNLQQLLELQTNEVHAGFYPDHFF